MTAPSDGPLLIEGPKAEASDTPIIDLEAVTAADAPADASGSAEHRAAGTSSRWKLPSYAPLAAGHRIRHRARRHRRRRRDRDCSCCATARGRARPTRPASCRRASRSSAASLRRSRPASPTPSAAPARSSASSPSASTAPRRRRPSPPPSSPRSRRASTVSNAASRWPRRRPSDVTGSVTPKEESKPQVAEGWRLRDFYDGRAVVESRNGTLFRVAPGIERAGARQGRDHQARERQGGGGDRPSGIIAATLEPRRPAYYLPLLARPLGRSARLVDDGRRRKAAARRISGLWPPA